MASNIKKISLMGYRISWIGITLFIDFLTGFIFVDKKNGNSVCVLNSLTIAEAPRVE